MPSGGRGNSIIAIIGENDALVGLNQKADIAEQEPIEPGKPGHGCGHRLLGTAGMEAACAVKEYMEKNGTKGTIRYYGAPAEEGGGGKIYMVLDGRFDDVDLALSWHPGIMWDISKSAIGVVNSFFKFEGKAAHAAGNPEMGRSALDALELTNIGIQFLREHVRQGTYIHYSITNAGGSAANIVQPEAEGFYVIRSGDLEYLAEVYERVLDIARGAALMTGTKFVGDQVISAFASYMPNDTLDNVQLENIKAILPLDYTEEELEYGRKFLAIGSEPNADYPFAQDVSINKQLMCTDLCDVGWITPTSNFNGCTYAKGTIMHNWAAVAQGKSKSAKRGMHAAAKVLANSAVDLFENTELIDKARAEFNERMKGKKYRTLMEKCTVEDYNLKF